MAPARPLLLLGTLAFFHAGALQALYGPSFAALSARHGVGVADVGGSVAAHFLGAFVGVLLPSVVLARTGYRPLLVGSAALMAAGAAGVAAAPAWAGVLLAAGTSGLGYGLAVVLYNLLLARLYGARGAMAVNVINGAFGIGAVAAPAAVASAVGALGVGGGAVGTVFGGAAVVAALVAVLAARTPPVASSAAAGGARGAFPIAGALLFGGIFFVYVAVEVSTAAWAPTHLEDRLGPARAALTASLFWIAMTAGRFAAALVATRTRPGPLVVAAVALGLAGIVLTASPTLGLLGYALAGLALGPVFPTCVAWMAARFGPDAERVGPVVLAAGNLGPVLGAPAVGVAVAAFGVGAIPAVLGGVLLALLALTLGGLLSGSRPPPP